MKETLEMLALVDELAKSIKAAKADGVINWMDIPKFAPLIASARLAIEGSDKIDDEFRSAAPEEMTAVAERSLQSVLALVSAIIEK